MAIIKCKMCGGDIELAADKTFGTCEFCGSTMTFPKVDDEQRAAAFNRGNHFRRIGEFDKALAVYERIVREDDTDAEAHWCCALCRFGIEYVEDPSTYEWLPTCHRASFDSFLEDVDYLAAVEHSEGITKRQYQKDGAKIAEIQRGILATSQNEEPFDVFICYKESDESGERTKDSLMAQDVYYQLTDQGYRVFFARITLEDMVGKQYEPYIFAALNSAQVMIVIGTKPEYMSAVWVKNEWSRFLAMMKKDRKKLLLPCYRDMDPYDMPEQLSVLQSYDMSKIGFMQDLIRGIKKVIQTDEPKAVVNETAVAANANTAPLLKRAFMFLEDEEWASANEYCEKVLDIDPECAEAYLGKLMASLRVRKQDALKDQANPFDGNNNYQKTIRFADESLKSMLIGYIEHIKTRNENTRLEGIYIKAKQTMVCADEEAAYRAAETDFRSILSYKDAAVLADQCAELAETTRKNDIYNRAKGLMQSDEQVKIKQAIPLFESISGWLDADELKAQCPELAETARKDSIYNFFERISRGEIQKTEENWAAAKKGLESISGWRDADALARQCVEQIEKLKKEREVRESLLAEGRRKAGLVKSRIDVSPNIKYPAHVALTQSGQVLMSNNDKYRSLAEGWTDISAISMGEVHVVAMTGLGKAKAVGSNDYGQCNVSDWSNLVDVKAGGWFSVGLQADGHVCAVGHNEYGQCHVQSWKNIVKIAVGKNHTVGLKADGSVVAVGLSDGNRCNVHHWRDIVDIWAYNGYTVGLRSDGTVLTTTKKL